MPKLLRWSLMFYWACLIVTTLLWPSVGGEAQHLEKMSNYSPPGLPNVQSSTAGPKTPRIGVLLVSLEIS